MELEFKVMRMDVKPGRAGTLGIAELKNYIDFEVKRIYFVSNATKASAAHSHLEEKEFFIMAAGSCIAVIDRGNGLEEISLHAPASAIYVGNFVWHFFKDFSPDAVLCALASTNHDPSRKDYIEDYELFKLRQAEILAA